MRTLNCECGHSFERPESETTTQPVMDSRYDEPEELVHARYLFTEAVGIRGSVIITPSGKCPMTLNSIEHDAVFKWCDFVVRSSPQHGCYTPESLKYFARQFFDYHSDDYRTVCRVIDDYARTQMENLLSLGEQKCLNLN